MMGRTMSSSSRCRRPARNLNTEPDHAGHLTELSAAPNLRGTLC
jgi:hypothetical protein